MPFIEYIAAPAASAFDPYIQALGFTAGTPDVYGARKSIDGGVTWASHTSPINGLPVARLITSTSKLIGTKDRTPRGVYRSTDGGLTWSLSSGSPGVWALADDGAGTLLATEGNSGTHIWRSTDDGVSWTDLGAKAIATQSTWLVWTGSLFLTVSSIGNSFATSPDGSTWTNRSFTGAGNFRSWLVSPTRVMGFHSLGGSTTAALSTDGGLTFSAFTMPATVYSSLLSSVYANGLYVTLDINAGKAFYSSDGINWSSSTMPGSGAFWIGLFWVGDKFVALSAFGSNTICTSADAVTWTVRDTTDINGLIVV